MSMFDSYDYIDPEYIPNNTKPTIYYNMVPFYKSIPYPEFNIKGELVDYKWTRGDTLTLQFSTNKEIFIEDDALVYTLENEGPTESTKGIIGQRAYNTTDLFSWTCTEVIYANTVLYTWEKDYVLMYPENGTRRITLTPDLSLKELQVKFFNFRGEEVLTRNIGHSPATLNIDEELSNSLLPGLYTCCLYLLSVDDKRKYSEMKIRIESY